MQRTRNQPVLFYQTPVRAADAGRWASLGINMQKQRVVRVVSAAMIAFAACSSERTSMNQTDLSDFGNRYAAAWSSQDPALLASFYAEDGSLTVNGGPPSVGRAAVKETTRSFMTAFPDMVVKMTHMEQREGHTVFHWLWTGTNTGPGGTGKFVRMVGYEEWKIDNGLIAESKGHYDEAEYQRQLKVGAAPQP